MKDAGFDPGTLALQMIPHICLILATHVAVIFISMANGRKPRDVYHTAEFYTARLEENKLKNSMNRGVVLPSIINNKLLKQNNIIEENINVKKTLTYIAFVT